MTANNNIDLSSKDGYLFGSEAEYEFIRSKIYIIIILVFLIDLIL